MSIWSKSRVEEVYCDATPAQEFPAEVRVDDGTIIVNYTNEDGVVDYRGKEVSAGHFQLTSATRAGEASLHRFPESPYLEGFWREGQYRGFWRIELRK